MTKLEEEIDKAMCEADRISSKRFTSADYAKAAAEVAKKYIKKAWDDRIRIFFESGDGFKSESARMEKWLKENGIE